MSDNQTVKCPSCKEVFKVDDSVYTDIVKQVRDQQFNEEVNNKLQVAENEKQSALQLQKSEINNLFQKQIAKQQSEIEVLKAKSKSVLIEEVSKKNSVIQVLQSKIDQAETEKKLELRNVVGELNKQKFQLENDLKNKDIERELLEKSLKVDFTSQLSIKENELKFKDDQIANLKDYKLKQSTKMIGETLEIHCETEFNKLRATAFPKE